MQPRQIIQTNMRLNLEAFTQYPVPRFPTCSIVSTDIALEHSMNRDTKTKESTLVLKL